jgi:hypothetical protein
MSSRARTWLLVLWFCLALRLVFYAAVLPMWEGLDEWGHMAYVDHLRQTGSAPQRETLLSGEIEESLRLAPLAPHLPPFLGGGISHTAYWRLSESERLQRQEALRLLRLSDPPRPGLNADNYQAQHPPIAYRLMSWMDSVLQFPTLTARVFALRLALVLVASCSLPLLWMFGQRLFADPALVMPTCLLFAVMPNFAMYVSRVANDPLAITLMALCLVIFAGGFRFPSALSRIAVAALLTAVAALTKAYGILLVPVYLLVVFGSRAKDILLRHRLRNAVVFLMIFAVVAGWWYVQNIRTTGALSGEKLDSLGAAIPLAERLPKLLAMDWPEIWMLVSSSYFWIGGWSFLLLRGWMYWVLRAIWLLALGGLAMAAFRMAKAKAMQNKLTTPEFWLIPVPLFMIFLLSIFYQSWQIFSAQGQSTAIGWYLCSISVAMVPMLVAGMGYVFGPVAAPRVAALLAVLFAGLDLFTFNLVSLPYYAGLTSLAKQGPMPVVQAHQWPDGGVAEVARRLSVNHPEWLSADVLLCLWALYLLATLGLALVAIRLVFANGRQSVDIQ